MPKMGEKSLNYRAGVLARTMTSAGMRAGRAMQEQLPNYHFTIFSRRFGA